MKKLILYLFSIRLIPHLICFTLSANKEIIIEDIKRWCFLLKKGETNNFWDLIVIFIDIMTIYKEYRNLFYYRIKISNSILYPLLKLLCRPLSSLYLHTKHIGPGLFIEHGFSTIVAANIIGRNCNINQQVTIGYSNDTDCPIIGNNVIVSAGAKVIGKVTIGDNSKIGANAVVVKNVPSNCTVVGVPAYIVRKNGIRITEPLK